MLAHRLDETPRPEPTPIRLDEVRRLREIVAAKVRRSIPGWMADRADDVVQIAMIRILKATRRDGRVPCATYARRAAYSAMVDEIRRVTSKREGDTEVETLADPAAATPERRADDARIAAAIEACLAELSDGQRRAVTLYLLGHKVPEAATICGWDRKRTENYTFRGLARLRHLLRERGITP